ncbi:MAG: sugar transferase [Lachnospiraceae bacterium]|nr:sugar transferase [Lachnospiraceae bacterium]
MYNRGHQGIFKHIDFILWDLLCLELAYLLAFWVRHGLSSPYASHTYRNMALFLTLMDVVVIAMYGTLKNVLKRGYYKEFSVTVKHTVILLVSGIVYLFLLRESQNFSRTVLLLTGIIYMPVTWLVRVVWKQLLCRHLRFSVGRSLLIVTKESGINEVVENLRNHNYEGYRISGIAIIDNDWVGRKIDDIPVVADRSSVFAYVSKNWVDEVFLDLTPSDPATEEMYTRFHDMGVVTHMKLVLHLNLTGTKQFVESFGNYTVMTTTINAATPRQLIIKKLMDLCGGLIGCLFTGVLALILGPIIYIKSPGPIFFTQKRVGKNGKIFKIYKFRSMYLDAEQRKAELMAQNKSKDGFMFKVEYDPRIIGCERRPDGTVKKGIGNFIRDWSLDEFPQFFNVLKGDMSLVGTRPPTLDEWEKYDEHHRKRLSTKPGLTGMWQVSGRSQITDFEEVVRLDTKYISEWNPGLDIKILLKTVVTVFTKKGAM